MDFDSEDSEEFKALEKDAKIMRDESVSDEEDGGDGDDPNA